MSCFRVSSFRSWHGNFMVVKRIETATAKRAVLYIKTYTTLHQFDSRNLSNSIEYLMLYLKISLCANTSNYLY